MSEQVELPEAEERDCPFCKIIDDVSLGEILWSSPDGLIIRPLNPVTPGHALAISYLHEENASSDLIETSSTFRAAADYARFAGLENYNLITSTGPAATQTVMHLHVHIIPRSEGDGLVLPWTNQKK